MSIPVELDALEAKTSEYGWAYLLTVNDDQTPKIVAVRPTWDASTLGIDERGRSARNASARPTVTLTYPPIDPTGYTLIVDGTATVSSEDRHSGPAIRFSPIGAVLHRPAPDDFAGSATGCSHDCAPID